MRPCILSTALLCATTLSCGGDGRSLQLQTLTLTGSSTVAPLAAELGKRFEQSHPVRVDVQSGGSSRGLADARAGHANLGMASRALAPSESDLTSFTIARDGVGLIVNGDSLLDGLSAVDVRAIYTGRVNNWSEVGGAPGPVTVVHKAAGRATLEVFLKYFGLADRDVRADIIAGENEQAIKTVAGTPGSIGYVSIGTAEVDIAAGVAIRLLALDGVPATSAAVADGSYPMARPLNLVSKGEPGALAREFIDFARAAGQTDLVRRESFVPVHEL